MKILLYFILGVAFYAYVIPLLDSVISLIVTFFELQKAKLSLKLVKYQQELGLDDDGKETTYAIGFDTGCYCDQESEEEEEDI